MCIIHSRLAWGSHETSPLPVEVVGRGLDTPPVFSLHLAPFNVLPSLENYQLGLPIIDCSRKEGGSLNILSELMITAVIHNRIARQWVLAGRFMKGLLLTTEKV